MVQAFTWMVCRFQSTSHALHVCSTGGEQRTQKAPSARLVLILATLNKPPPDDLLPVNRRPFNAWQTWFISFTPSQQKCPLIWLSLNYSCWWIWGSTVAFRSLVEINVRLSFLTSAPTSIVLRPLFRYETEPKAPWKRVASHLRCSAPSFYPVITCKWAGCDYLVFTLWLPRAESLGGNHSTGTGSEWSVGGCADRPGDSGFTLGRGGIISRLSMKD